MSKLDEARKKINEADREIARLFEERMKAAEAVAEYKIENGLPILDAERERTVIESNSNYISDPVIREYYIRFITETMSISRSYQSRITEGMRVAYSGTVGAFAHIAAGKIFPSAQRIPFGNFSDAYEAVVNGECDCAVLPLENSYAGEVGQVIDKLFSGSLYINGIYDLPVIHNLVSVEGADRDSIKTVVSHPQALSQCSTYIREHGLDQIQYQNTATAAEYVKEKNDPAIAAICSEECAEMFGLRVVETHINKSRVNTTRFGVFSRLKCDDKSRIKSHDDRFILMFTVRNQAGALAEAINILAKHGFNMTAIRSRPMKELLWSYYFYVECEGNLTEGESTALLGELSSCCDKLKLCGTYKTVMLK